MQNLWFKNGSFKTLSRLLGIKSTKRGIQTSSHLCATAKNHEDNNLMKSLTNGRTSYATTVSNFHLVTETIGNLIDMRSVDHAADMAFGLPHQGILLTYSELKQRVDVIAQNYLDLGFKKGERVAFLLPNCYELIVSYLAACKIGLISVVLNPAYQAVELEYMLNKTGVKGVFFYDSFKVLKHMELFNKLCPELETSLPGELVSTKFPNLKHLFVLNSPLLPEKKTYKGTWDFTKFSQPKSNGSKIELPYVDIDDPCTILFTVTHFISVDDRKALFLLIDTFSRKVKGETRPIVFFSLN